MERKEIVELLKVVSANYPHAKISDPKAMVTAWEMLLGEFSAESVYKAARLHMTTNKYFPSASDIRDNIVRGELVFGDTLPNAIEAKTQDGKNYDEYLDKFCEWIGFGCEENDTVELPKGFLPYEV